MPYFQFYSPHSPYKTLATVAIKSDQPISVPFVDDVFFSNVGKYNTIGKYTVLEYRLEGK